MTDFLRVVPDTIRFAGYKTGETIIRKLTLSTTSVHSLRMNISTDFSSDFELIMNKKGKIASGLSQEITITFSPKTYKLYLGKLVIMTELGKIIVPVEAYPVLNPKLCLEFSKIIDFKKCEINQFCVIKKRILSISQTDFDFEFFLSKVIEDFQINPIKGTVFGNQSLEIQIMFAPRSIGQHSVEVCVR